MLSLNKRNETEIILDPETNITNNSNSNGIQAESKMVIIALLQISVINQKTKDLLVNSN